MEYHIFARIRTIVVLAIITLTHTAIAAPEPILIDLTLSGMEDAPYWEPSDLQLIEGQAYLLILENPFDLHISLLMNEFGQTIQTQYLQGASGMGQKNMMIPEQTRVTWLIKPKKAGKYMIYAVNMESGRKGRPALITIHAAADSAKPAQDRKEPVNVNQSQSTASPTHKEDAPVSESTSGKATEQNSTEQKTKNIALFKKGNLRE